MYSTIGELRQAISGMTDDTKMIWNCTNNPNIEVTDIAFIAIGRNCHVSTEIKQDDDFDDFSNVELEYEYNESMDMYDDEREYASVW